MQFSDLYGTQLDIELGSADRTQLFTTARRKKAVNDAMHNFERLTSATPVYGNMLMASGIQEYDLLGTFSNYVSLLDREEPAIKIDDGNGNIIWIQGDALPRRTPHLLDRGNPGWLADPSGTPTSWYLRDDAGKSYVGVDPPPLLASGATWTLRVPYLAQSTDMAADTDQPFTVSGTVFSRLVPYHQALVHYAAGLLEPLRKNYSGAKRQMDLYAGYVAQYETKKRKDGPSTITFTRNYFRASSRAARAVDPHRWP